MCTTILPGDGKFSIQYHYRKKTELCKTKKHQSLKECGIDLNKEMRDESTREIS